MNCHEKRYWRRPGVFSVNFEHISHLVLVNFEHVFSGWDSAKHFGTNEIIIQLLNRRDTVWGDILKRYFMLTWQSRFLNRVFVMLIDKENYWNHYLKTKAWCFESFNICNLIWTGSFKTYFVGLLYYSYSCFSFRCCNLTYRIPFLSL